MNLQEVITLWGEYKSSLQPPVDYEKRVYLASGSWPTIEGFLDYLEIRFKEKL